MTSFIDLIFTENNSVEDVSRFLILSLLNADPLDETESALVVSNAFIFPFSNAMEIVKSDDHLLRFIHAVVEK